MSDHRIAIAPFLRACPGVITLGVRPSLGDYPKRERELLASCRRIFFPTPRFVRIFEAAGKETYPSSFSYRLRKSRVSQEVLFQLFGSPHPRTRLYYGHRKDSVLSDFRFPLRAMGPDIASAAYSVQDVHDLEVVAERYNPLIIQEELEFVERFRLIFANYDCIAIHRRDPDDPVSCHPVFPSHSCLGFIACDVAPLLRSVQLNEIAVEIGFSRAAGWQIIEMRIPPVSWASEAGIINRHQYLCGLVEKGVL